MTKEDCGPFRAAARPRSRSLWLHCALIAVAFAGTAPAATVAYDNMTAIQSGDPSAHVTATGSTPNYFMGDGYTLAAGTTNISGFDLYPVNLSGAAFTNLKMTVYVWDTVNTSGTVNSTTPAFGNLLGSYTFDSGAGSFASGSYYPFEGPAPGTPGMILAAPLALSDTTIGLTFNFQGSTDGVNYSNYNGLSPIISYGVDPAVGTSIFDGYYRNANSEIDGNFTSSLRSLSQSKQTLGVRVYTETAAAVPEPGSFGLIGAGALALLFKRRAASR